MQANTNCGRFLERLMAHACLAADWSRLWIVPTLMEMLNKSRSSVFYASVKNCGETRIRASVNWLNHPSVTGQMAKSIALVTWRQTPHQALPLPSASADREIAG